MKTPSPFKSIWTKVILMLAFALIQTEVKPQTLARRFLMGLAGPIYKTNSPLTLYKVPNNDEVILKEGSYYQLVQECNDSIFIKPVTVWRSRCDSCNTQRAIKHGTTLVYNKLDPVKKDTVYAELSMVYASPDKIQPYQKVELASLGFTTLFIPIKYRLPIYIGNSYVPRNFTTDLTIGPFLGYKFHVGNYHDQSLTIGVFGGPSLIRVDNTEAAATAGGSSSNFLGFSTGKGVVYTLRRTQIGFIMGRDFLSGKDSEEWIYDGRRWFSFAIGYKFLDNS